jgi:hypothetical protein
MAQQQSPLERAPAHERQPVLSVVTPLKDLVFWEKVDYRLERNRVAQIGDPHWNPEAFPHHVLCAIRTVEDGSFQRFFYAAKRENQDDYNFEIGSDDRLIRTYVIPRDSYPSADFPTPVVGTADARFPQYVFASQFLGRLDDELDGVFVSVRRVYSIPETVAYEADQKNEAISKLTRRIIPAGTGVGLIEPGRVVEIAPQNTFFDMEMTTELVGYGPGLVQYPAGSGLFPFIRELTEMPASLDYNFPPLLKNVYLHGVWALADSSKAAASYNEDFFFELDMEEPSSGPYPGVVKRFLTDNPAAVMASYPIDKINPRRDTFGMLKKWFSASTEKGNSTFALARQFDTGRPCIHNTITLPAEVNYVDSAASPAAGATRPASLVATRDFSSLVVKTSFVISVVPRPTAYGLWEVQVAIIKLPATLGSFLYNYTLPS